MSFQPRRRPRDPLALLILALTVGMTLTLAYQVYVHYGDARVPIARQTEREPLVGG